MGCIRIRLVLKSMPIKTPDCQQNEGTMIQLRPLIPNAGLSCIREERQCEERCALDGGVADDR